MKNAVFWWLSLGLISISFAESTPLLALFLSGFGGAIVGKFRYSSPLKNGSEKANYQRSLIFAVGAALFAAVVYFHFDLFNGNPFVILSLCSLALFSWLVFQKTIYIGYNSIVESLYLLVVSYTISTFLAVDYYSATRYLFYLTSGILVSICIWVTIDNLYKFELGLSLFIICGVVIVIGSIIFMQIPPEKVPGSSYLYLLWPDVTPRVVHYNYVAGILTLYCPLSVWFFLRKKTVFVGFGTFLLLTGLLLTQSRSAIFGVVVSIFLTSCFRHRCIRPILTIATASAIIATVLFFSEIFLYAENLLAESSSLSGRFQLWQRALSIFHDFPFTGVGPGSFSLVGPVSYPVIMEDLRITPHVHNMYLQVVVVAGAPGFVAFWMFIGAFFQMFKQLFLIMQNSQYEYYALGLGGGIIAHLIYGLTDAIVLGEIAGILFWMVVGFSCLAFRLANKKVVVDSLQVRK